MSFIPRKTMLKCPQFESFFPLFSLSLEEEGVFQHPGCERGCGNGDLTEREPEPANFWARTDRFELLVMARMHRLCCGRIYEWVRRDWVCSVRIIGGWPSCEGSNVKH